MSLGSLRREYRGEPLSEASAEANPFDLFARWFEQARAVEADPTAMSLATATADGRPSARMVLLKGFDARGFVFYTNYDSRKAHEIESTHHAALLFYWASLERQVRVEGPIARVSGAESDAYFASRPLESRWSAHASPQSRAIDSREALEAAVARARAEFGDAVPRPAGWGGFRVSPDAFEFWQGRENRLHDRLAYALGADGWRRQRLAP
ncbi:MAG TPA: pyridoxamine 5'-phosphate oxidase [Vicinamibacterales bacterium]|jgi:pyridoxamine 5'-phosphate oxidase|nr:pyridoxamine 5'-phosphate oxidase [Vicinamibacterales bacterium]